MAVGQLRVAEGEPDTEASGLLEEGLCLGAGHLGLVEGIELEAFQHPAREEGGQGQLGEGHELGAVVGRRPQEAEEALDDVGPPFVPGDRSELGPGDPHGRSSSASVSRT